MPVLQNGNRVLYAEPAPHFFAKALNEASSWSEAEAKIRKMAYAECAAYDI